jgi:hypothetical protein
VVCGGVGVSAPLSERQLAEIRGLDVLGLVGERNAGQISAHFAVLLAEVDRLRGRVTELETGRVLPWAAAMSDEDLHGFLNDLLSAAMGRWQSDPDVPDRDVLAAIETACADWRTPGQGYRSDDPEAGESR